MTRLLPAALVASVVAAVAITGCGGGGGKTHKALCWDPAYAKTHTLHNATTFKNLGHDLPLGARHCRS